MALTNRELADLASSVEFYINSRRTKSVINGRFVRETVNNGFSIKFNGKKFYRLEKSVENHEGILTGWDKQSVKKGWIEIDKNHSDAKWWKRLYIKSFRVAVERREKSLSCDAAEAERVFITLKKKLLEAHESFNGTWKTNSDYDRMVKLRKLFDKVFLTWPSEIVEYIPEARLETFEYVERNAYGDAAIEAEDEKIDELLDLLGIDDADLEEDEDGNLYHIESDFKLIYLNPNGFRTQMTMPDKLARRVRSILR